MELHVHNLNSLAIAAVAMGSLVRISTELVQSLDRVAHKYSSLVTCFQHFAVYGDVCTGVIRSVTILIDFSLLTFFPYAHSF
ncbi:hypothetical protein DPMN_191859 [Dreissena polymorpha]|uniref:Uncharacterized protein n=1 Tax=Dreissena polymorpha TaxID=45954 RepID=A0A9D3XX85_DREPO|nr:hypothetical protein DPMN_191859 [Dreissena polymorpha]